MTLTAKHVRVTPIEAAVQLRMAGYAPEQLATDQRLAEALWRAYPTARLATLPNTPSAYAIIRGLLPLLVGQF